MRTRLVGLMLLTGCFVPTEEHTLGTVADAGVVCLEVTSPPAMVCAPITPVVCSGARCASGEDCCFTTGKCFDPHLASSACPPAAPTTITQGSSPGATPCASNSDCGAGEYCRADSSQYCLGGGHCASRANCGSCGPAGHPDCQRCGCNGVTYESSQAACVAGVRVVNERACGSGSTLTQTNCGLDSQCPEGARCCAITGKCYPPSEAWRCTYQPDGSVQNCASNQECNGGAGGGSGSNSACGGEGCGTPGVCRANASGLDCGGDVSPVCGCDGHTYINDCWARVAGARITSPGECRDAGP